MQHSDAVPTLIQTLGLGSVDPELLRPIKLRGEACRATRALLHARDRLVRMRERRS